MTRRRVHERGVRHVLMAGKRSVQLATVAPDRRKSREHAEDGTFSQTGTQCPNGFGERQEQQLRAIAERTPEPVINRAGCAHTQKGRGTLDIRLTYVTMTSVGRMSLIRQP